MKCPFCRLNIIKEAFAVSPDFIAIYDISPMLPGHTLIIPREHEESLHDMEPDKLAGYFQFAREITKGLCDFFNTDAFDWSIQEKEEAGQSVSHLHLHIIPRTKNDLPNPGDWYPILRANEKEAVIDSYKRPCFSDKEFQAITEKLRKVFPSLNKE